MNAPRLRPPHVAQVIADICADCPEPCAWQRDPVAHADACRACPIRRWSQWGACPESPEPLPGDVAADLIERHVLGRAREHAPGIVAAVERCGGCGHAKHAMGSRAKHPDPGTVV